MHSKLIAMPVEPPPGDSSGLSNIHNPVFPIAKEFDPVGFVKSAVPAVIALLLIAGSLVFFFIFIMGAIQWIASGGDKQALEGARGRVTSALIGLVILFSTFAIIKLIEYFFGVSILALDIGSLVIR